VNVRRAGRILYHPRVRWLYHIAPLGTDLGDRYAPASLVIEGFVHCSFRDEVRESALLYFPREIALQALRIDPRRLDARVELAPSPRGPMPHVLGPIPRDAVADILPLDHIDTAPDRVTGARFGFVAFEGMTLLDLVGALDPIGRIASMGFDPSSRTTVISAASERVWTCEGAALVVDRVRPRLDDFDVLVVPGGSGTRTLVDDRALAEWLATFPHNRLITSVCTGSLLLGAAGRLTGRRATTHRSALTELPRYGATPVDARVVDEGQLVTAAGVSCAIDLGIHLVRKLEGDEVAAKIAAQMHLPDGLFGSAASG
jgi:putative intracellular protease/amidase